MAAKRPPDGPRAAGKPTQHERLHQYGSGLRVRSNSLQLRDTPRHVANDEMLTLDAECFEQHLELPVGDVVTGCNQPRERSDQACDEFAVHLRMIPMWAAQGRRKRLTAS